MDPIQRAAVLSLSRAIELGRQTGDYRDAVRQMMEIDVEAINDYSAGIIYAVIQVQSEDLLTTMVNKPGLVFEVWLAQEPMTIEDAFRDWPQGAEIFVRVRDEVWSNRSNPPPRPNLNIDQQASNPNDLINTVDDLWLHPEFNSDTDEEEPLPPLSPRHTPTPVIVHLGEMPPQTPPEATPEAVRPSEYLHAAERGDIDTVRRYLDEHPRDRVAICYRDTSHNNAYHLAAKSGNRDLIALLDETGLFDITLRNLAGAHAGTIAERYEHVDLAAELTALITDKETQRQAIEAAKLAQNLSQSARAGTFAERLDNIKFPGENIPIRYKCPISLEIMDAPIVINGETYDRSSLQPLFQDPEVMTVTCPVTTLPITRTDLNTRVCKTIKETIEEFVTDQEKQYRARNVADSVSATYKEQMRGLKQEANTASSSSSSDEPSNTP